MTLSAFNTALTGLNNNALTINVVGNNLANINTTAFKASKTSFSELMGGISGTSDAGDPIQVGLGSISAGVNPTYTQGAIGATGKSTDAAINGNGFFVVSTGNGMGFTRAGNFSVSSSGELVNTEGFQVLGYPAVNGVVNSTSGTLAPIQVEGVSLPPKATSQVTLAANLDGGAADGTTFTTGVQVYDSLGDVHTVTFTFTKNGATGWKWDATIPAVDVGGKTTDPPVSIKSAASTGALTFDGSGKITSPTANETLSLTGLANGASPMNVTFAIFDPQGNANITGYAGTSTVSSTTQDGYATSSLRDIAIDKNGVVNGLFDNGKTVPLAQLATANFPNVQGLVNLKGSTMVPFGNSGDPSIGAPGTGGRGTISGGALEQSNVDIATEFTTLIVAQRGYQANSRVISTTDQLVQDSLNLIR